MEAWVKQWTEPEQRLPKGNSSASSGSRAKGAPRGRFQQQSSRSDHKRFKPNPTSRLQAVENLSNSAANLAKETARTVASLICFAIITILCPTLEALKSASRVVAQDPTDPLEVQSQRWGCLSKGLAEDPKTSSEFQQILRAHVAAIPTPDKLKGKLLHCHDKQTFCDSELYLVHIKVSDELQPAAHAVIQILVKAGGLVSFLPA
eukprot:TRINITY_DN8385_c0_g3_i2.p1 TRINITY_DN8385_c0_g3~~TRINITY_DN8385_c0_g3_i2.p1  ORF type:complete len:205 (-),score=37.90 TRINITY_DN8385_c0_g3_i2:204-818(-)